MAFVVAFKQKQRLFAHDVRAMLGLPYYRELLEEAGLDTELR